MINKLQDLLVPNIFIAKDGVHYPEVTIHAEEVAKIFAVLLATANLLDSPSVKNKGDLADCLSKGMERMIIATEDLANVQKAFNNLGKE